jgi:hypothetical protein
MNMQLIEKRLTKLENKLLNVEQNTNKILSILELSIEPNCHKMENHVNFVEKIYETTRKPLNFIFEKISKIRYLGYSKEKYNISLPTIEKH